MAQEDKVFLNLAGEFAVASELNRRRVLASVTYGASKSADVFAMNADMTRVIRIEVKTTQTSRWPVGERATRLSARTSEVFWVLVHLPSPLNARPTDESHRGRHSPRYFVLSAEEMLTVWKKGHDEYCDGYKARHGSEFAGIGVPTVTLEAVASFENRWSTIRESLEGTASELGSDGAAQQGVEADKA
jgi:hypothetical protein